MEQTTEKKGEKRTEHIGRAKPKDLRKINSLFRQEYGQGYPYPATGKALKDPKNIYVVARDKKKGIVGIARSIPVSDNPHVYENGSLLVLPEYRGKGVATRMSQKRMAGITRKSKVDQVYTEASCREGAASQHNSARSGFKFVGLLPGAAPGLNVKSAAEGLKKNGALHLAAGIKEIKPAQSQPVFLPSDYAQMVHRVAPTTQVLTRAFRGGPPAQVRHYQNTHKDQRGSEFADVEVNTADALIKIAQLRKKGYLFSAFLPSFGFARGQKHDVLRLYRPVEPVNIRAIKVHPTLEPVKDFMHAEYKSTRKNKRS